MFMFIFFWWVLANGLTTMISAARRRKVLICNCSTMLGTSCHRAPSVKACSSKAWPFKISGKKWWFYGG